MPPERFRGPYKRYLNDVNIPVSRTTAWRRKKERETINNQHQNLLQDAAALGNNVAAVENEVGNNNQHSQGYKKIWKKLIFNLEDLEKSRNSIQRKDQQLGHILILTDSTIINSGFQGESDDGLSGHPSGVLHHADHHSSNETLDGDVGDTMESDSETSNRSEPVIRREFVTGEKSSDNDDGGEDSDLERNGLTSASDSSLDSDDDLEEWPNMGNDGNEIQLPQLPQNNEADGGNHRLYEGSRLTKNESDVLIMSFIIRWGLEEKAIEHLLQLINCHLPQPTLVSQFLFLQNFTIPDEQNIVYTCSKCLELLPEFNDDGEVECEQCEVTLNKTKLKEDGNYFVQLSVTEQIRNILQNNSTFSLLRKECEESDVISGMCYTKLRERGIISINDLTLQWNTDSVSPYKSAKMQVWPILAEVNELPDHARRENMILCGLYYGKTKPNINAFLKPFVHELESLHNDGIKVTLPGRNVETTVKIHTLLSSVDSACRPTLQGTMQYNGKYGCSYCLKPGLLIERGRARIYAGGVCTPRTIDQHIQALQTLANHNRNNRQQKSHIQGVKHDSVLLQLPVFHIINSFVPDYLHDVLEGVVKTFINHWIDATYKECDWYLTSRKRALLSERMQSIFPPVEITRKPRGLHELKLLKAAEFRHFLLYYSIVCLKGLLPPRYLKHWFLLVFAMSIYLKEKFTANEAVQAKLALNKFVDAIAVIYPNCLHMYTFEVHLLLHVPRVVKRWGALWASSTFPYEHFNGIIARLMSGTRSRPEQVCRSFLRLRCISHRGSNLFRHPDSKDGKRLFDSLMTKYRSRHHSENFDRYGRLFGAPERYELSLVQRVSIQTCLNVEAVDVFARSFKRLIFKGVVYHASIYDTLKVRDNSSVRMNDGQMLSITRILLVKRALDNVEVCVILGKMFQALHENLTQDLDLNLFSGDLIHVCHKTERVVCRKIQDLHNKCVQIPYGNAVCIVPLVKGLERD